MALRHNASGFRSANARCMRTVAAANASTAFVSAPAHAWHRAAHDSAESALCPAATSCTTRQAGSINAAPWVGHDQSTAHERRSPMSRLLGLMSPWSSAFPRNIIASVSSEANRSHRVSSQPRETSGRSTPPILSRSSTMVDKSGDPGSKCERLPSTTSNPKTIHSSSCAHHRTAGEIGCTKGLINLSRRIEARRPPRRFRIALTKIGPFSHLTKAVRSELYPRAVG